jgi:hypothetical protein
MNATSAPYPRGINGMREAGLDPAPSGWFGRRA